VAQDWHRAMTIAIAVLIITCPCALGLAVPIVHVVAARRLFEAGVMVKDGSALERLAEIDRAVFDKTGTLTLGQPRLANAGGIDPDMLAMAAALGRQSRHPLSGAVAAAAPRSAPQPLRDVAEHAGLGIEGRDDAGVWRLGRAAWARADGQGEGTVLTLDGQEAARFEFDEDPRPGGRGAVSWLEDNVGPVEMLSGDEAGRCAEMASALGIAEVRSSLVPAQKVARLEALRATGHRPLMVGDGLNDAPALAAAHVSMAPASAADVGRAAADFVFLRPSLDVVPVAIETARRARALVQQNIAFAIAYNAVAVPIAVLGHATPLVAAIAMSLSSVVVIANALRLMRPAAGGQTSPAAEAVAV
jgi:P-type Cu2+ transporter